MARRKASKYARLLKEGEKFYQPDTYPNDIWTVKRVQIDDAQGLTKVFVENRTRALVLTLNQRVNLHHG